MKKIIGCIGMMMLFFCLVCGSEWLRNHFPAQEKQTSSKPVENWAKPDLEYLEFYGLDTFSTSLPVVYIDTQNTRITKENKSWASIAVLEVETDGVSQSVFETPDYEAPITIKYRGASSYSQFDKKQYRIKFYKKEGGSKPEEYRFLGMGANSEWVLNGPFLDKTLIRNHLVYNIGREIFSWAPDSRYFELFIDGEYQGVYLAVEPVTNGETRLRLADFGMLSGKTAYIVKRDRVDTEIDPLPVYGKINGKTNNDLFIEYPSVSDLTDEQREWIIKDISSFEAALYGEDFANKDLGYAKYIDVDNFVDYFILNEVVMNHDAGNLSTYAYKDLAGKLMLAIWDYNNCYDNYQWFAQDYTEFFLADNAWFSRLLQDRQFVDQVVKRYGELRADILSEDHFLELIDLYQRELGDAIQRNFAVWGYTFDLSMLVNEGEETERNSADYESAVNQLKSAIEKRFAFLDHNLVKLYEGCVN